MKNIQVGLIGFGNIGAGVVKLLRENADVIRSKVGTGIVLKRIADLDITTDRGVVVDPGVLTTSVDDIFNDPEISIVIELIGGYEPAKSFVLKAIERENISLPPTRRFWRCTVRIYLPLPCARVLKYSLKHPLAVAFRY